MVWTWKDIVLLLTRNRNKIIPSYTKKIDGLSSEECMELIISEYETQENSIRKKA